MEQQGVFINEDVVKQLLKILNDNSRGNQANEFTDLVKYVDTIEKQLGSVMNELQDVKAQLDKVESVQGKTLKDALSDKVNQLGGNVKQMKVQIAAIKDKIIKTATSIVNEFNNKGIITLGHMAKFSRIEKSITTLHENIQKNMQAMDSTIHKVNSVTQELNAAIKHTQNAARLVVGKERNDNAPTSTESLVKPLKAVKVVLAKMEHNTRNSIEKLNHLSARATEAEKKPSILQSLKSYKKNGEKPKDIPKKAKVNEAAI